MTDLTQYKMKDIYTTRLVKHNDAEELGEWLKKSYATLTPQQENMIDCLVEALNSGDEYDIKWYGVACGLEIEPVKKTRRRKT